MAVEKMQGISRLEQFVEELSEEERAKELKQEKKRQKRKNRRKNKCGFEISEQEAEDKEKNLDEVIILAYSIRHLCLHAAIRLIAFYLHPVHVVCCRVLLSLWRALARSVVATMKRRRPDVKKASPPMETLHVAAQTTPNRVKMHTG